MKTTKRNITGLVAVFAALQLTVVPAQSQQSCTELFDLAAGALPSLVGDVPTMEALASVAGDPGIAASMSGDKKALKTALKSVDGRSLKANKGDCRFDGRRKRSDGRHDEESVHCDYKARKTGATLSIKAAEGRLTFLDPTRSFQAQSDPDNAVTDTEAAEKIKAVAIAFGLDESQLDYQLADIARVKVASVPLVDGYPDTNAATVQVAEVYAAVPRQVQGTGVYGSRIQASIDHRGQVARMHLRWPEFRVCKGLASSPLGLNVLDRSKVTTAVVEEIGEQWACGTAVGMRSSIMYVPASDVEGPDSGTDEANGSAGREDDGAGGCYVPALVVQVTGVEPLEDSGDLSSPGVEYLLPLLDSGPGSDNG
ncbi:MAG: hypothetical protein H8E45_06035 [Proteobacteria bacterium]|nr:hypothetical protein [Pseudomonadota bacterium]